MTMGFPCNSQWPLVLITVLFNRVALDDIAIANAISEVENELKNEQMRNRKFSAEEIMGVDVNEIDRNLKLASQSSKINAPTYSIDHDTERTPEGTVK